MRKRCFIRKRKLLIRYAFFKTLFILLDQLFHKSRKVGLINMQDAIKLQEIRGIIFSLFK
jgi:hypothetical protein